MAKILATEIRGGILIETDGRLRRVVKARHVHVGGRGGAYMQVETKDVEGGGKNNLRLRTDEKVERPFVDQRKMRFLYDEGDAFACMDEESFEQLSLGKELFEGRLGFMLPESLLSVNFYNGRAIGAELPPAVVLTVKHTDPQARGATASSSYKPAEMETGITVMVPPFINSGEKIRVNTDSGEYMERA